MRNNNNVEEYDPESPGMYERYDPSRPAMFPKGFINNNTRTKYNLLKLKMINPFLHPITIGDKVFKYSRKAGKFREVKPKKISVKASKKKVKSKSNTMRKVKSSE